MRATVEILFCIFTVFGLTSAQIIYRGKCKKTPVQENFNVTRFAGTWHEVSRSFMFFQLMMRCVETDYTVKEEGGMDIKIRGIDTFGIKRSYEGNAYVKDSSLPAKLKAKFRIMPMSVNYYVLKTDYDSYAVMWSCNNLLGGRLGHTENMWLLSRVPVLKDETKHRVYLFLDEHKIKRQFLERNPRQEKCKSNELNQTAVETTTTPISTTVSTTTIINQNITTTLKSFIESEDSTTMASSPKT